MKRSIIIGIILAAGVIIALIAYSKVNAKKEIANLYVETKKGQFDILVTTTGELQAEKSTDIRGPEITQSRNIRVMDIKITDLVAEGTEVKEGDYVATLDKTSFDNTLKDELERLTTFETNLEVRTLDTAVTLSNLRDQIINLKNSVEEARIVVEQSQFEPPTTIRQAEINLDKAKRSYEQFVRSYSLRLEQSKRDMKEVKNNLAEQRQRVKDLETILTKFVITAPSSGMIIYKRDRMNVKRKVGSSISAYDNVVATLPDMSSMISKTYVNEIDVSKVKPGQKVEIIVDAFPEKKYSGSVLSVANIGEQLPNADAKVFEVMIKVNESDPILRPSMTTGNKIVTKTIDDVTFIPLECVQNTPDSIPFVYMRKGTRQVVLLGESNENNVIVEKGIESPEMIYLSTPENAEKFKLIGEELITIIKEREKAKKAEELKLREEATKTREGGAGRGGRGGRGSRGGMRGDMTPEMMQEFQNRRGNVQNGQGGRARDTSARRQTNTQTNQQN